MRFASSKTKLVNKRNGRVDQCCTLKRQHIANFVYLFLYDREDLAWLYVSDDQQMISLLGRGGERGIVNLDHSNEEEFS